MRELSSLTGLQVVSMTEARRLGSVAEVLVDLAAGDLVCVTLANKPELQAVLAEDIEVIGPDALMVSDRSKIKSREDVAEELKRGKAVLSDPPAVITSKGTELGTLGSVYIDEGTLNVIRFEVSGGPLKDVTEGILALPILEDIAHGEDTVIVPHEVVARRLMQAGGLRGTFRNLAERMRAGYEDLSDRSEEWLRESGEKLRTQTEQARERATKLTDSARERADKLADEAKEKVAEAREAAEDAVEGDEEEQAAPEEPEEGEETHLAPEAATPLPGDLEDDQGDEEAPRDTPESEDTDDEHE